METDSEIRLTDNAEDAGPQKTDGDFLHTISRIIHIDFV